MNPVPLPDGSRLVSGFRRDPKARYWQAPDFDGLLRALGACKSDYFAMNRLRGMVDGLGRPPDDEDVLRRIAHEIRAGHLAWEYPAPPVPIQGDSGTTGSDQPQQKSESKPAPKSAPPPSPPAPKDAPPPPPKQSTPPPSKPGPTPPRSGPSGTTPKPPPIAPPKPPVVIPPVVGITATIAGGKLPDCIHDWEEKGRETPDETITRLQAEADALVGDPKHEGERRGKLFEIKAIKDNLPKMQIQATSVTYQCRKCPDFREVDVLGKNRLAEAKSRTAKQTKTKCSAQARSLASVQKQLYPPGTLPLAKIDKDLEAKDCRAIWERRGFEVEPI